MQAAGHRPGIVISVQAEEPTVLEPARERVVEVFGLREVAG